MKVRILILMLMLSYGFQNVFADENNAKNKISYNDYIVLLESALPELTVNELDLLSAENKVSGAEASDDAALKGGGYFSESKQYAQPGTSDNLSKKGYSYYTGLSKSFAATGTSLSTTYNYAMNRYSGSSSAPDYSTYEPSATLKLTQPLLYNFFGIVDRFSRNNAKMEMEISKNRVQLNKLSILNAYKKLYFQWIVCRQNISNLDEALRNSTLLRDQIKNKVNAGLSDNDDYQSAVASVLNYENQLMSYRMNLTAIDNQLREYITVDNLSPDPSVFEEYTKKASESQLPIVAFGTTTSSRIMKLTIENYLYSIGVYKNKLLPELNLISEVTRKGFAESSSYAMKDTDYRVGFECTYLLGGGAAKSELKEKEIQLKSIRSESQSAENKYQKNMLNYISAIEGTAVQLRNKEKLLKALESQHQTEVKKFNQGRLNLSYVITTENTIASEKINIVALKYEMIGSYLDYLNLVQ